MQKLHPFLWFNDNAEEAAHFYQSVFPGTTVGRVVRYPQEMPGVGGKVLTIEFSLLGQTFVALNGGPKFQFNESVSFVVNCSNQAEVDYYWVRLSEGGETSRCGWLKDRFGLSWQVVPTRLVELLAHPDDEVSGKAFQALMQMDKIDLAVIEKAAEQGVDA